MERKKLELINKDGNQVLSDEKEKVLYPPSYKSDKGAWYASKKTKEKGVIINEEIISENVVLGSQEMPAGWSNKSTTASTVVSILICPKCQKIYHDTKEYNACIDSHAEVKKVGRPKKEEVSA